MSDISSKIESERNALQQLAVKLPGFGGYFREEERREADRMLRDEVVRVYGAQLSRLNDLPAAMLESGQLGLLDDVDRARTRLQTFIDRVRTAAHGYASFFAAVHVDEDDLARVYAFDLGLLEGVSKLSAAIDALAGPEATAQTAAALVAAIDELNTAFGEREQVLLGIAR